MRNHLRRKSRGCCEIRPLRLLCSAVLIRVILLTKISFLLKGAGDKISFHCLTIVCSRKGCLLESLRWHSVLGFTGSSVVLPGPVGMRSLNKELFCVFTQSLTERNSGPLHTSLHFFHSPGSIALSKATLSSLIDVATWHHLPIKCKLQARELPDNDYTTLVCKHPPEP